MRQRRHAGIGIRVAQRRRARAVPRRHRSRPRALLGAPRAREPGRAHRGHRPAGADTPLDGSHRRRPGQRRRLAARSVRRRGHRRRDLGSRRGRHAEPHGDDGRRVPVAGAQRVPAARDARVSRGCRRGEPGHLGCRASLAARDRRRARRLRRDRGRRFPDAVVERTAAAGDRRREGFVLVPHRGARDTGARVATVPDRQRARDRGGDRPAPRRVPPTDDGARHVAPLHRRRRLRAGMERAPARRVDAARLLRGAADRAGASGARVHAHDVRADGDPRRHEDQRHSRPHRRRSRHPLAARPAR